MHVLFAQTIKNGSCTLNYFKTRKFKAMSGKVPSFNCNTLLCVSPVDWHNACYVLRFLFILTTWSLCKMRYFSAFSVEKMNVIKEFVKSEYVLVLYQRSKSELMLPYF